MVRKGGLFAGCTVALVTPFRDGGVDYDALGKLVPDLAGVAGSLKIWLDEKLRRDFA